MKQTSMTVLTTNVSMEPPVSMASTPTLVPVLQPTPVNTVKGRLHSALKNSTRAKMVLHVLTREQIMSASVPLAGLVTTVRKIWMTVLITCARYVDFPN